jgi:hypothetical protein
MQDLPTQNRGLMPEFEISASLLGIIPRQEHQPADHPNHEHADEAG